MGCEVLSPRDVNVVAAISDFLFVASDLYRSIVLVENRHLHSIGASDFLWLVAPDGHVGQSASLELGFAIAKEIPIYCERRPPDLTIAQYVSISKTPKEAIEDYRRSMVARSGAAINILLDPVLGVREAHRLIDEVGYLLARPGLLSPTELDKEVALMTKRLREIFDFSLEKRHET